MIEKCFFVLTKCYKRGILKQVQVAGQVSLKHLMTLVGKRLSKRLNLTISPALF